MLTPSEETIRVLKSAIDLQDITIGELNAEIEKSHAQIKRLILAVTNRDKELREIRKLINQHGSN